VVHHGESRLAVNPEPFGKGLLGVILASLDGGTAHGTGIAGMSPVQHLPKGGPATGAGEALKDSPADGVFGKIEENDKIEG
jgi:hypothetical protein